MHPLGAQIAVPSNEGRKRRSCSPSASELGALMDMELEHKIFSCGVNCHLKNNNNNTQFHFLL